MNKVGKSKPVKTIRIILLIAFLIFGIGKFVVSPEQGAEIFGNIGGTAAQYFTGVYETVAAILVFFPATAFIGALMIAIAMVVAFILHLTIIGINIPLMILSIVFFILALKVMKQTRGLLGKKN